MPLLHKVLKLFFLIVFIVITFTPYSAIGDYQTEVTPRLVIGQEYDDNIDLEHKSEKSDFITTASPGITINTESTKTGLSLDYAPTWARYWDYEENNTVRHNGRINLWHLFTKYLRLNLEESYQKSEMPYEGGGDGASQTVRHTRDTYERNNASISLDYQFGSQDHIKGGYMHQILDNEDPTLSDSVEHGPFASLFYWFDINNGVELNSRFSKAEYELESGLPSEDDFSGHQSNARYIYRFDPRTKAYIYYGLTRRNFKIDNNDYRIHDFSLGLDHGFSPLTSISLAVGLYKPKGDVYESEDPKLFSSAEFRHETENLKMNLGVEKGWDEGLFEAERRGFTEFWSSRGSIEYQSTEHLNARAAISYRANNFRLGREDEQIYQGECGLRISFLRWYSLDLGYTHTSCLSDDLDVEYIDNRVMLTLSASRAFQWK